jgi:hypothetical protein
MAEMIGSDLVWMHRQMACFVRFLPSGRRARPIMTLLHARLPLPCDHRCRQAAINVRA